MTFIPKVSRVLLLSLLGLAANLQAGSELADGKTAPAEASPFAKGAQEFQIAAGNFLSFGNFSELRPRVNDANLAVRLGWMLTDPKGAGVFRGNVEFLAETFGGAIYEGPGSVLTGVTLLLRYNFVQPETRFVPYFQLGFGGAYSDAHEEQPQRLLGAAFSFNLQAGFGARYFCSSRCAIFTEATLRHLSNASLAERNAGMNSAGIWLGASYFF